MYTARAVKPKLSVSIAAATGPASRPALSLKSPMALGMPKTPLSPSPLSPTARNTRLNQQGHSIMQQPTFAYSNTSSSKSILKRSQAAGSASGRSIQFNGEPTVHCITPIQDPDYYGGYTKMSRDERRWMPRSYN